MQTTLGPSTYYQCNGRELGRARPSSSLLSPDSAFGNSLKEKLEGFSTQQTVITSQQNIITLTLNELASEQRELAVSQKEVRRNEEEARRSQNELKRRLERIESFPIGNLISKPNTDTVYRRKIAVAYSSAVRLVLGQTSSVAGSNPDMHAGHSFVLSREGARVEILHLRRSERLRNK